MLNGMKCALCGKGVMFGHSVSHAKNRTRKIFKPNLHRSHVTLNGVTRRVKLCTKCLRTVKKEMLASKTSTVSTVVESSEVPQVAAAV